MSKIIDIQPLSCFSYFKHRAPEQHHILLHVHWWEKSLSINGQQAEQSGEGCVVSGTFFPQNKAQQCVCGSRWFSYEGMCILHFF